MAGNKNRSDEQPQVFRIPSNFIDEGKIFGGMFKTRNAAEAIVILAVLCYPLFKWVNISLTIKISIAIIFIFPIAVLALVGINDGPLSEFIKDFFKYIVSKKNIKYRLYHNTNDSMKGEKNDGKILQKSEGAMG